MDATLIVCTWNRAALLARTLARFCELRIPSGCRWEVLVVNNGCTDGTNGVIRQFARSLPLRSIYEPIPGKSRAANRALTEAQGELLLWTDDDVLVDRDWLASYLEAAAVAPGAAFFGGPIAAQFVQPPPNWLHESWPVIAVAFAERHLGPAARVIASAEDLPFGANMAIRREAVGTLQFNENLGPTGQGQIRGEELELLTRILAQGAHGWWAPAAAVKHLIPPERATREYLAGYFLGAGRQMALARGLDYRRPSAVRSLSLRLKAFYASLKFQLTRGLLDSKTAMRYFRNACIAWGAAGS